MMFKTLASNTKFIFLIVFAGLFLVACSPSAESLNQEGNEAFAEQAYLEALQLYQSAQIESPELAEPYYNAANVLYRQGDYPAALEQMQMALGYIDEESLAESSLYNLGNAFFNSQELGTAVEAYTQALLLDPDDLDAKYNLELALQQQQHQQQEQEQQQEEQQEQDQEQQQEQQQDGESDSQEQEGGSDSESQPEGDQEEKQGESQNGADQQDQNQDSESKNSDQSDQQQEGEQQGFEGNLRDSDDQQDGDRPGQIPPPGQRMTEEQARQLLAAISNDMETLQEKLGQYLFARSAPPVQDW